MLSTAVTDYVLWIFGTALPSFIGSEPVIIITSCLCAAIVLGFVGRLLRPPKI